MEILRFEEAAPIAPKRKKSSKGYITVGFVAALFSVGSAFATSSISISGGVIGLGQGVAKVTGCDPAITVTPHTTLIGEAGALKFRADYIDITDINSAETDATTGLEGRLDKDFEVKFYDNFTTPGSPVALTCDQLNFNKVVFQDNLSVTATKQKCITDAVYFRVGALGYRILVNNLDPALFDNITLVSTNISTAAYN